MGRIEQQVIREMSFEALVQGSEAHRHASRLAPASASAVRHFNRAVDLLLEANQRANGYAEAITVATSILKK